MEPRVGESQRLDVLKGPENSGGDSLSMRSLRAAGRRRGSEAEDSVGEGKFTRDERVGIAYAVSTKAVAGRRQEPTRTFGIEEKAEGGPAKANRAGTVPLIL